MDEDATKLDAGDNDSNKYKMKAICNSAVYTRESESSHLPGLYYLVFWKGYLEEENTWELALAVQHFRKLINLFYKDHPDKPTVTFEANDTTSSMAKPIIKPTTKPTVRPMTPKQKRGRPSGHNTNKQAKKN